MAIEAVCQPEDLDLTKLPPFHLQNFKISKALVLSEEGSDLGVEIHTNLHPVLSLSIPDSGKRWQFSVTSILCGETTTHADGQIIMQHSFQPMQGKLSTRFMEFEQHSVRSWYDRMSQVGLEFTGPFKSLFEISHPKERDSRHTRAMTHPYPGLNGDSSYLLHPATIDGILLTALIATADGALKDFRIRIPVHSESISIQIPHSYCSDEPLIIHGVAEPIGIDSMRGAVEVSSQRDGILMVVQNCRLVTPFHGKQQEMSERHPMLRVSWKPDITRIEQEYSNVFPAYLDQSSLEQIPTHNTNLQELLAALELMAHKHPALRVSETGNENDEISGKFLDCLHFNTAFKRCKTYARSTIVDDIAVTSRHIKLPVLEQYKFGKSTSTKQGSFDLLIVCTSKILVNLHLEKIREVLSAGGGILGHFSSSQISELTCQGFVVTSLTGQDAKPLCIARKNVLSASGTGKSKSKSSNFVIVERNTQHPLNTLLVANLSQKLGQRIERIHFDDLARDRLVPGSTVVATVELERPFFSTMTNEELASVKVITDSAKHVIWITGGGQLAGIHPDFAVVSGLSRAIMLEQPALKFATFDVDDSQTGLDRTISNCMYVVDQILSENTLDFEFVQSQGTLHISRFTPEKALNSAFRQKQGFETIQLPLEDALPCQLAFEKPGEVDTAYFKRVETDEQELRVGDVEVSVRSIDLNLEAMDVLGGKIDTESGKMMLQITGTVTKVGASVTDINPGDRVV
ncbi:hypothetical protein JMJ35_006849 [Cladonia borealis]|uniref:PKS/mFAS DH domain-containing protein n=1 Tax=Cladonia borealis TaxID=184061 RepID=A0AA39V024_9LECA|nr:hypothetical protein JMJ35_006849 [Cladonia borealis]